jgi:hypothetical protein
VNTPGLIRDTFTTIHNTLEATIADCSPANLDKRFQGATIDTIAEIYAHLVCGEDNMVNVRIQGKEPLYVREGWSGKPGVSMPEGRGSPDWLSRGPMDLAAFRDYARAVHAATDAYLASASDTDLEGKVMMGQNERTAASILVTTVIPHIAMHTGEIAALKGLQGLKGLPF